MVEARLCPPRRRCVLRSNIARCRQDRDTSTRRQGEHDAYIPSLGGTAGLAHAGSQGFGQSEPHRKEKGARAVVDGRGIMRMSEVVSEENLGELMSPGRKLVGHLAGWRQLGLLQIV